jgi:hypothetical protein
MYKFKALSIRVMAGVLVGLLIGIGIWVDWLWGAGHTISESFEGQVEDGLGKLQGLACLGALIGIGVGFVAGLIAIENGKGVRNQ